MSGFVDTLEQNKEFRRDFNRVLRFINGLFRAQNQVVVQSDIETGTLNLSNASESNWFVSFMRSFVNTPIQPTATASTLLIPQPHDLVWQDTLAFLNDIKKDDKNKIKEKFSKFVTDTINNTNNSRYLTQEQKDLILDKLFADPYKNKRMSLPLIPESIIFTATVIDFILMIKFLSSSNNDQKSFDPAYGWPFFILLLITIIFGWASYPTRTTFEIPIAEDSNSLVAWAHEISEELLRLQIPCESDASPIVTAVIADMNDMENYENPALRRTFELFNRAISFLVALDASSANLLLQDNMARRSLDNLIKFMYINIAKNNAVPAGFPESAVKMYLQIREKPNEVLQILQKFVNDWQTGVHASTQITDLQKNALLDLIITDRQRTTASASRFKTWLFDMERFSNRFNGTFDPLTIHQGEAVSARANTATNDSTRLNRGYELVKG
jgi:hypothetical protein